MKKAKKWIVALLSLVSLVCLTVGAVSTNATTNSYNHDGAELEWQFDAYGLTKQIAYKQGGNDLYVEDSQTYNYAATNDKPTYVNNRFNNAVNPYLGMVDAYNDYQVESDGSVMVFKNVISGERTVSQGYVRMDLNSGLDISKPISIKFFVDQNEGWTPAAPTDRTRYLSFSLFDSMDNLISYFPENWWSANPGSSSQYPNSSMVSMAFGDLGVDNEDNRGKILHGKNTAFTDVEYSGSFVREWHTVTFYVGTEDFVSGTEDYSYVMVDGVELGGLDIKRSDFESGDIYLAMGGVGRSMQVKVQLLQPEKSRFNVTFSSATNGFSKVNDFGGPDKIVNLTDADAPVIDGHTFIGWYLDEGCTVEFTKQTLSSDLTIYAKYRNNSKTYHTVTVTSLVGNYTPVTLLFEEGSKLPTIGNVFNAEKFTPSFVDESGAPITTETVVNDDMTIYAEWTENPFTLYYRLNDAEPMLNSTYSFDKYETGWDKAKTLYKDEMAGSYNNTYYVTPDNKIVINQYYGSVALFESDGAAQMSLAAVATISNLNKINVDQEIAIKYSVKNFDILNGGTPRYSNITFRLFDNLYDSLSAGHLKHDNAKVAIKTSTVSTDAIFGRFYSVHDNVTSQSFGWNDTQEYEIRIYISEDGNSNYLKINGTNVNGALRGVKRSDFAAGYAYLNIANEGASHEFNNLSIAQDFYFYKGETQNGTYTTSIEEGAVEAGTSIVVTLNPAAGYGVKSVKLGDKEYKHDIQGNTVTVVKGWGNETLVVEFAKAYAVTFNTNGGSSVETQYVLGGDYATRPAQPSRPGYTFRGWYANPEFKGGTFNFTNTAITEDITLYVKWAQQGTNVTPGGGNEGGGNSDAGNGGSKGCSGIISGALVPSVIAVLGAGAIVTIKRKRK